jgi:hypothetical protein
MRGRLIRIGGRSGDATVFAVAEPDGALAVEIIRKEVTIETEYVEDLGRVSDDLIKALDLKPGEFKKV